MSSIKDFTQSLKLKLGRDPKISRKSIRAVVEDPQADEYYVLVMRYYPMELRKRGLKLRESPIDVWDRDLAPSRQLHHDVRNGVIGWVEYKKRFLQEVPIALMRRKLAIFQEDAKGKDVVLVCQEKEIEYPKCHTWIILEEVSS